MRQRNHESLKLNLTLDAMASETLKELQQKTGITTVSEVVRRAIRAYYMLMRLDEEKAQIKHKDGSAEPIREML